MMHFHGFLQSRRRDRHLVRHRGGGAASATFAALLLVLAATSSSAREADGEATAARDAVAAEAVARRDVLATVTRLFDGMRERDEAVLRTVFAPGARLGKQGIEDFIRAVVGGTRHLDEITFDETVLIDGDLAMAWTPYNIFIDGEFHHCGVDLFVMRRVNEIWRITHLDDTRRTDGCDPERRS